MSETDRDRTERIIQRRRELYKETYGKRNPATLSTEELDRLANKADREVQREISEELRKKK